MAGDGDEVSKEAYLWCSECKATTRHYTDVGCKSWDAGYIDCTVCGAGREYPG